MTSDDSFHNLTVISKKGCHLCEQAVATLESMKELHAFTLTVLNIEDDKELFQKYWIKVPVVRLDGADVFEAEDIALPTDCRTKLGRLIISLS